VCGSDACEDGEGEDVLGVLRRRRQLHSNVELVAVGPRSLEFIGHTGLEEDVLALQRQVLRVGGDIEISRPLLGESLGGDPKQNERRESEHYDGDV
jgi:hypothetical protein